MKAIIVNDDLDRHGEDCECGDCDSIGRAFGAGIYNLSGLTTTPETVYDDLLDYAYSNGAEERCYGPTQTEAVNKAVARCKEEGWDLEWAYEFREQYLDKALNW